jgi:hypothetical protein
MECLVGRVCLFAVQDCRHLQLKTGPSIYWTNCGLLVVLATLVLLQVQLRLTCLDLQHQSVPTAFAGLVQRPVQDWSF